MESLERQLNLLEALLRQQRESFRGSSALQTGPSSSSGALQSTNILTAAFLTIRETLGSARASEIMYEALVKAPQPVRSSTNNGEEEISTTETLIRCLCQRVPT